MKTRIFKALPAYGGYISDLYRNNALLASQSFDVQLNRFREDCFQWIMSWGKYNNDPDVEIIETVLNSFPLQNAWGNGTFSGRQDWMTGIVLEQIKAMKPHVCLLYSPEIFTSEIISRIKESCPHVIIGGYDGMNRQNISKYDGYDFVITCSPFISDYYSRHGIPTFPMCFGFDEDILRLTVVREKQYDVSFSGSFFPGIHNDRFDLISYLNKFVKVSVCSEFAHSPNGSFISRHVYRELKTIPFNRVVDYLRLYKRNIGPLYGLEMFQFLRDSRVVLNMHGDKIGFAANIRLFEATGVGSCLLTDWKENLPDLFEPGKEVLAYHSIEEAKDIAQYCLNHPEYTRQIALNGQKRVFADYSQRRTVPEVISFVKSFC